jgi:cold shock CspA family protein
MSETETITKPELKQVDGVVRKMKEGYGFIAGYDGIDYFMHWTAMSKGERSFRDLIIGDRVKFEALVVPNKGPRAVEVVVVG